MSTKYFVTKTKKKKTPHSSKICPREFSVNTVHHSKKKHLVYYLDTFHWKLSITWIYLEANFACEPDPKNQLPIPILIPEFLAKIFIFRPIYLPARFQIHDLKHFFLSSSEFFPKLSSTFKHNTVIRTDFGVVRYTLIIAFMGAVIWKLPSGFFWRILWFPNTWTLMNRRKFQNPLKITLHGNCHGTASRAIKSTKVPFLRWWSQLSVLKNACYGKLSCCSARWGWCLTLGFIVLFECQCSKEA